MKVKIGKYPPHRWYHNFLYEKFGIENRQKVSVIIDPWDTWGMDTTLAHIVVPMLIQLRDTKVGAPPVSFDDRPDHLIGTVPFSQVAEDEFYFDAWDWVLGEMIFSFESKNEDWEDQFHSGIIETIWVPLEGGGAEMTDGPSHTFKVDWEGQKIYQARINNGFRLFGKYYGSLWD